MLFYIQGLDKPEAADVREANRNKHRKHLALFKRNVLCAGPLLDDDGETKIGTLILCDFDDKSAAEGFLANDPYVKAGLFQSLTVRPWRQVQGIGRLQV